MGRLRGRASSGAVLSMRHLFAKINSKRPLRPEQTLELGSSTQMVLLCFRDVFTTYTWQSVANPPLLKLYCAP